MVDYSLFYKRSIDINKISLELSIFDIFISAHNNSDRVKDTFDKIQAIKKVWLIHPEYKYVLTDLPNESPQVRPRNSDTNEKRQVEELLTELGSLDNKKICIDCTGFMRHVLIFLLVKLESLGLKEVTVLYSEPMHYLKQENTIFSTSTNGQPRSIAGMYGSSDSHESQYFLIIGVGYDHKLISEVIDNKEGAIIYPVYAFPPLSADMYQQSALRVSASLDQNTISNKRFAPANDPFATASVISDIIKEIDKKKQDASIYLAPLSTKAQVLGFTLYWLFEGRKRQDVTMFMPECIEYSQETSKGLKRLWSFTIEFSACLD